MQISIVYLVLNFILPLHDIHVSNTDLHYKSEQQSLQVTVSIFLDDLELAIKQKHSVDLRLFSENELADSDSLLSLYIHEHLNIKIHDNEVRPEYLGKEISDDLQAGYFYLEFQSLEDFSSISISNSILLEIYDDQRNLVNIKKDRKSKAFQVFDKKILNKTFKC